MNISRRTLLAGTALLPLGLAACPGAVTPTEVITDLENIGSALTNDLPALGAVIGISSATIETIQNAVAAIVSVGTAVAGGTTSGASGVQAVFSDIEAVISAAAPFALLLPGPWTLALAAAQVVLPILAGLVNIVLPAAAEIAGSPKAKFRASLPLMTLSQAEAELARQAKKAA